MFSDQLYNTSYKLGAYQAIAEMMRDAVRQLEAAQPGSFEQDWARRQLVILADQFDETNERFEQKEVDTESA